MTQNCNTHCNTHQKIKILDDHTINKIAAGEVIENPSSVVKELVENSIDAKANFILVEIKTGGRQLIRITDNGFGMGSEDAKLCLKRHATSKIRDIDDLFTISSMGFRGEAVPSIASISKMTLHTCNGLESTFIYLEGGKVLEQSSAPREVGTTFEIKELFFNVPVRKKFQRSPTYDTQEIAKVITLQALAHPEISFQLISDSKSIIDVKAGEKKPFLELLKERAETLLGQDFLLSHFEGVQALFGKPCSSRHNRSGQYLFINRRPVFSPFVSAIVKESYATTLPEGRYPTFVLHLDVLGDLVDINVHPQKKEVRLREQETIKKWLFKATEQALFPPKQNVVYPTFTKNYTYVPANLPREFFQVKIEDEKELPKIPFPAPTCQTQNHPKILGTLPNFIVLEEQEGGLTLVDQRAAQARIFLEKKGEQKQFEIQMLAIPYTLEFTNDEAALLLAFQKELDELGFDVKEFGEKSFILHSLPLLFSRQNPEDVIRKILNDLQQSGKTSILKQENEKRVAQACAKARLELGRKLSFFEAEGIIRELFSCKHNQLCPYGKPILIQWTQNDLIAFFQNSKKF
jgi:DNA mismatch repair protein MutL